MNFSIFILAIFFFVKVTLNGLETPKDCKNYFILFSFFCLHNVVFFAFFIFRIIFEQTSYGTTVHQKGIGANQPIHSFLVACLNPCLQRTNVWVVSPRAWKGLDWFSLPTNKGMDPNAPTYVLFELLYVRKS